MKEKHKDEISDLANPNTAPLGQAVDTKVKGLISDRIDDKFVDDLYSSDRSIGFSTGFRSIDKLIGGLKAGHLNILAAVTGSGKSYLSMGILVNVNKLLDQPVLYIDLENGSLETTERLIRLWNGELLPRNFFLDPKYKQDVIRMKDEFKNFYYYSQDDFPEVNKENVLKLIRYYARAKNVKVFLVDPLECIPGKDVADKEDEEAVIARALKNIAQQEKVCIILCHHLRKGSSNGRDVFVSSISEVSTPKIKIPVLDDVRGASGISNAVTGVWALARMNRAENGNLDKVLFRVLKNRFGKEDDAYLNFSYDPIGFTELTTEELLELAVEKEEKLKEKRKKKKQPDLFERMEAEVERRKRG